MVAATRPFHRTSTSQAQLMGTDYAARHLKMPGRTVRRWVQQRGLGVMVAGRRVLTKDDLRLLQLLRDGALS